MRSLIPLVLFILLLLFFRRLLGLRTLLLLRCSRVRGRLRSLLRLRSLWPVVARLIRPGLILPRLISCGLINPRLIVLGEYSAARLTENCCAPEAHFDLAVDDYRVVEPSDLSALADSHAADSDAADSCPDGYPAVPMADDRSATADCWANYLAYRVRLHLIRSG